MNAEKVLVFVGSAAFVVLVAVGSSILFAYPVMWLWNWLMPAIFGIKAITLWQALGLNILSAFLFKGFGSSSK